MELTRSFDAVIVGSGAGGAAAAWRLTSKGTRVLMLEAGPRFDPVSDYPLDSPGWERRRFPAKPGSRARISYGDLGAPVPQGHPLAGWSRGGQPWPRAAGQRAALPGYSHVRGVGGSTLHFVGEAHRLHPDAFRLRTLTGAGEDWPIGYDALEPYYTAVEEAIGVAGDVSDTARWRSRPYSLPPHPISPGAEALRQAGARIGQNWTINPRAVLSQPYRGRPACNYCGQCSRGCPLGDKGSVDVTLLADALATGLLTLLPDTSVTRIITAPGGRIGAVEYLRDGTEGRVETPVLVLAAGAVETPRLLLLSAGGDQPGGVANGSGHVGRHFMETLSWRSVGLVPDLAGSHLGLPADMIDWGPSAPGQHDATPGGFRLNHATAETGLNGPIGYATRLIDGFGTDFKAAMRAGFGTALAVGATGQVIADGRSRVTLDGEVRDTGGRPVARISSVLTKESLRLLEHMATAARAVLSEAGAELAEEAGSGDAFGATHAFGTARMGDDPATSVVDARGRSHDHPNLWIADASVFPTSGGGEAPSLTIMALAARTADAITAA